MSSTIRYHAHIDGIRAVAVIAVILFHLNPASLPGGFVGVDIFFVISGFLITSIMVREHAEGRFSFSDFYIRRMKRILPALFVVIVTVMIVGYFLVQSVDYEYIYRSARFTWMFASNYYFMTVGDYFSPQLHDMPLLHTWSLGVEEQFYFIWPVLLLLTLRRSVFFSIISALVLIAISMFLSVLLTNQPEWKQFSYFMLPTRLGELLLGGLIALIGYSTQWLTIIGRHQAWRHLLEVVAGGLLIYSFYSITAESGFPGYQIIWPCLATALLIITGLSDSRPAILTRILASSPFVSIGLLSYSLYLWHWPVQAFIRYATVSEHFDFASGLFSILLTLILAGLSYRLVELPCRYSRLNFKQSCAVFYLLPLLVILGLTSAYKNIADKSTYLAGVSLDEEVRHYLCPNGVEQGCKLGDKNTEPSILILGDSHAAHFSGLINVLGERQGWSASIYAGFGCPTYAGLGLDDNSLKQLVKEGCKKLYQLSEYEILKADKIILANRWRSNRLLTANDVETRRRFSQGLRRLAEQGKQIILVAEVPSYTKSVYRVAHSRWSRGDNQRLQEYRKINAALAAIAQSIPGVYLWDLAEVAESFDNGMLNGKSMYQDDNHLNYYGSLQLAEQLLSSADADFLLNIFSLRQSN